MTKKFAELLAAKRKEIATGNKKAERPVTQLEQMLKNRVDPQKRKTMEELVTFQVNREKFEHLNSLLTQPQTQQARKKEEPRNEEKKYQGGVPIKDLFIRHCEKMGLPKSNGELLYSAVSGKKKDFVEKDIPALIDEGIKSYPILSRSLSIPNVTGSRTAPVKTDVKNMSLQQRGEILKEKLTTM